MRLIVEGHWLLEMGVCDVAGTTLVKPGDNVFNHSSRFVFLDHCSSRPVNIWPYDPFNVLSVEDPRKHWFDVIDRNQDEYYD